MATTSDIAVVAGVPRLTAHRDLTWLHAAGLVGRERSAEDRTHAWWYRITGQGIDLLNHDLVALGRPVPLQLGQRQCGALPAVPAAAGGLAAGSGPVWVVSVVDDVGHVGVAAAAGAGAPTC
ncbi:MarR family transcriptional regulator [Micromonospora marina]|uniref:MarR family transcriptional regulator n=1 Tax=Micromonospora marina TaxID=307120 RepID=UPI003D72C26A